MIELHCSDTGFGQLDLLIFLHALFYNTLVIFSYLWAFFEMLLQERLQLQ